MSKRINDKVRYKEFGKILNKLNCKFVGDFGSGEETLKKFINNKFKYKAYDYPHYNFEEIFKIKDNIDCIIFSEVFEHLRNPRNFLNSISQSVKIGTKLILTTPNSAFIKNRIQLLFGKTPDTFFGPAVNEAIYGKNYHSLSDKDKLKMDFQLHVRSYNYKELKKILELEGFIIIKRINLRYNGIRGFILNLLPINLNGMHFIIAEKIKLNKDALYTK